MLVFVVLLVEANFITPVGLLFFFVSHRYLLVLRKLLLAVLFLFINVIALMGLANSTSFRGTIVDGVSINCATFIFWGKVTDNFDELTTIILKRLFGRVSTIAIGTRGRFSSILCGNDSIINVPPSWYVPIWASHFLAVS